MRTHLATLLALAQFCLLAPLQSADNPPPDATKTFQLDGSFDRLKYKGTAGRVLKDSVYTFTIKNLVLTYAPYPLISADRVAVSVELVATTRPKSGDGPWTRIFVQTRQTQIVLDSSSPTTTIKELTFTIPKAMVDKADSVGFTVTDGKIMYPFEEELK